MLHQCRFLRHSVVCVYNGIKLALMVRRLINLFHVVNQVPGQNGDNPKRRQDKGNITKTATEKCGQKFKTATRKVANY